MIISHRHRFVFTAIPKTGTHSVRRALRAHLGSGDAEQVGLFVKRQLPIPELAALGHGHITLAQIRPYLGAQFLSLTKFAFVRNPFDRFVSYCAFVTRETGDFERNPRDVMRHFLFRDSPSDHLLFQPQHIFVTSADGELLTDVIGRVETMQASYDEICKRIGIPTTNLERVNSSPRADFRDYYDDALVAGVKSLYERDLELFGYDWEG